MRAYYAIEQTYADPDYLAVFGQGGDMLPKMLADTTQTESQSVVPPSTSTFQITAYPNPFNPMTTLLYQLREPAYVTLTICDILGRRVITLVETDQSAGYYGVQWSGENAANNRVPGGLYLYEFTAIPIDGKEVFGKSGKLLFIK